MVERMTNGDNVYFLPLRDALFIVKPNQPQPHDEGGWRDYQLCFQHGPWHPPWANRGVSWLVILLVLPLFHGHSNLGASMVS